MGIVRYTLEELKKLKGKSDIERLSRLSDQEIYDAALSDPDNPPLTQAELSKFRRITPKSLVPHK